MKNNNKKGFTLIELLVVVLIIGILAAIALPQYFKAVEKARGAEALSLFGAIAGAQQRYYLTRDNYAAKFNLLDLDFTDESGNTVGDVATFNTKNFVISLEGTGNNGNDYYVKGLRRNGRYIYELRKYYNSGEVQCGGTNGTAICPSLGNFSDIAAQGGGNGGGN